MIILINNIEPEQGIMIMDHCKNTNFNVFAFIFIALFSVYPGSISAANIAGKVESIKGTATAQIAGEEKRQLQEDSPFYTSDVISTDEQSTVELRFSDDTKFFIGTDSELSIEKFNYNSAEEEDSFSARITKGTFRFITGIIAKEKPESMEVNTAVATIGIRGTHVIGEADATSSTIILMEQEDQSRKGVIQVSNQYGSVTIDEPGYGTEIPDQFSPPSPPRRMRLNTINNIMRSIQSIQRISVPQPRPRMP